MSRKSYCTSQIDSEHPVFIINIYFNFVFYLCIQIKSTKLFQYLFKHYAVFFAETVHLISLKNTKSSPILFVIFVSN